MSCLLTTSVSSCASARHAALARVWFLADRESLENHSFSDGGRKDSSLDAALPALRWCAKEPYAHSACLSTQCFVTAMASSRWSVATGKARPGKDTLGASSKYLASTSPSIVALMSPSLTVVLDGAAASFSSPDFPESPSVSDPSSPPSGPRRLFLLFLDLLLLLERPGPASASPSPLCSISLSAMSKKSPSTVLSCTSSTRTCVTPLSVGSRSSLLSNTPVVQKSRRVLSQILDSPRMAYPIAP
mmetsp:Transcript_4871/g.19845  ORF Transcript_4871/g.19845 Transcript_4871/m.19845 type:complete len:245 (+) Transcript_4871:5286-6020(+)